MIDKENANESKLQSEISSKIKEQENYLKYIEESIFKIETKYLESTEQQGNIVKGWENYFSVKSKFNGLSLQKKTKFSQTDRIFSMSSYMNSNLEERNKKIVNSSNHSESSYFSPSKPKIKKKFMNSLSLKKRKLNSDSIINLSDLINQKTNKSNNIINI